MKKIKVIIPKGFVNVSLTNNNYLVADTNDSANWDMISFPLPKGKWSIFKIAGKEVILVENRRTFWTKWF